MCRRALLVSLNCVEPLRHGWLLRQRAVGVRADVVTLLESAAYFGIQTDLVSYALDYLEDHVDRINERSSIQLVYAMSAFGVTDLHPYLLLMIFRRIGAGNGWESERVRVFQLWICQQLQFPWLDARIQKRCIDAGLRAWVLHRRGYGCPFPDEVRDISCELARMGIAHSSFVAVAGTPYEVDLAVSSPEASRKNALLVIS